MDAKYFRRSRWLRIALTCALFALPAAANAQPLVYVAGPSPTVPGGPAGSAQLTVINSATGRVVKTVDLGQSPGVPSFDPAVVTAPDGARAYATVGADLVILNTSTYTTERLTLGGALGGIAISMDGSKLFVASVSHPTAFVVDTATLQPSGSPIPLPGIPRQLAVTADGTRLYILGTDTVYVADTATRAIIGSIAARPGAVQLVVHPDGSRLYVGNSTGTIQSQDGNSITAYDTSTLLEVKTTILPDFRFFIGLGLYAARLGTIAILPEGDRLYVPLVNAGFRTSPTAFFRREVVHVVDSRSLTLTASVTPLQSAPTFSNGITAVVSPGAGKVFVGATGGVSVIDVATNAVSVAGPGVPGGDSVAAAVAPPCWFEVSPQQVYIRSGGGSASLNVPAPAGCDWNASVDGAWVAPSATSGTGPATINLQIAASDAPRSGTVTIAGQLVQIDQVISRIVIDTPANGPELTLPFDLTGWTIEQDARLTQNFSSGMADAHLYDQPAGSPAAFLGVIGTTNLRPDIAAAFGDRYLRSGFSKRIGRLPAGAHTLVVYARSGNDGAFTAAPVNITVRREPQIVIDAPSQGATVSQPFKLYGWAADMTAPSGTGTDMVRISARRADGAIFQLGNATYGIVRPDVGFYFDQQPLGAGYELTVSGLPAGTYTLTAEGSFTAAGSIGRPLVRSTSVQVTIAGTAPFGVIDTPAPGATVAGTLLVTGWALSSVGVARVAIYRDPLDTETEQIWIGDARFVEGARPDVAAAFPGYPQNTRAGWGLAVLTNLLPRRGNGPLTFHAVAYDANNNMTLLGSPTVTGMNQSSVLPFGTLDTPGQGATVSGILTIFGWALTPGPNIIPTDGSTIQVIVDGVVVGQPTYNQCRGTNGTNFPPAGTCNDDIATAFRQEYRNLTEGSGAIGSFQLDTTTLTNGIHTLEWRVTDSAGNAQGIGSRYFYVQNGG